MTEMENKDETKAEKTIVHSTSSAASASSSSGTIQIAKKMHHPTGIVSVKVEPSQGQGATRLIHLVTTSTNPDQRPATPNILKRAKSSGSTMVTLAPKRPLTAYISKAISEPTSTTTNSLANGRMDVVESKNPLDLLAEEAARRTLTLNLTTQNVTSDLRLDPKFIGGPIIAGTEQIDIRKSEIVCQQLSEHKLSGPYVVLIAHSHREYRGHSIIAHNFEGFKEDNESMKRWPLRAWTDSAYNESLYVRLDIPKLGNHPVAIVTLRDENVINLRFPVLSSDRNNHGHKKFGRLWELIIFPYDKLSIAYSHWHITPIQIVAELRDPKKLKKPKRPDLIQQQPGFPINLFQFSGSPGFSTNFDSSVTSDEDSEQHAPRPKFHMDIKNEPMDDMDPDELTKEQLIVAISENYRQKCELLRSAPLDLLRYNYNISIAELNAVRDLVCSKEKHHFENGT